MAQDTGGEKSLPASPRKRQDAREKGNVAKSQDLNTAATLLLALLALIMLGPGMMQGLLKASARYFAGAHEIFRSPSDAQAVLIEVMYLMAPILGPILLVLLVGGIAVNVAQFGFLFSSQPLVPKFGRLNPIAGFQRFFSLRAFVDLVKSILKLTAIMGIVWFSIRGRMPEILSLVHMAPLQGSLAVWEMVVDVWWRIALAMLALGVFDFGFQYWQRERDLRMSVQEARQELRNIEGDPRIKQRVRQIQRQMAMQRMMKDVPKADVVITNPTTYAIAIRYEPLKMNAPIVIAKGARLIAERIRAIAIENDVPIVQRPELARGLYRSVEVGQPVSEDLFRAVAEVLAYVYQVDRRQEKITERETFDMPAAG